jgi:hypothetical protein
MTVRSQLTRSYHLRANCMKISDSTQVLLDKVTKLHSKLGAARGANVIEAGRTIDRGAEIAHPPLDLNLKINCEKTVKYDGLSWTCS